jgi:hypothetical protein
MPQSQITVNDLIIDSFALLGELGDGELLTSPMLFRGLRSINYMLTKFSVDSIFIPFLSKVTSVMVPGKDVYSISDIVPADIVSNRIVDLSFANFTLPQGGIVYPLKIFDKAQYYGITRLNTLIARPSFIFLDKQSQESFITFYPTPDLAYPFDLKVKQMIDSVVNQDTLDLFVSPEYDRFLMYALTRELKSFYPSGHWSPEMEEDYQTMYSEIKAKNETDLTIRPTAILVSPQLFYWQNILAY